MRKLSGKIAILLVLVVASGSVYFYLRHRRAGIIENSSSDSNLLFRNPTENNLLVYLNKDSFSVPANSLVYYAVNSTAISNGKTHIRAIDSKTGKIISDSTCQLSKDVQDYFINPTHTNYVHWDIPFMIVQEVNPADFQPIGPKTAMLSGGNMGNDTSSTSALIIDCKGIPDPTKRIVETSFTPEDSQKGMVHYNYVLTRADYDQNVARHTNMKDYRKIFWTETWQGYFFPEKTMKREEPYPVTEQ
ncbi:MAG TPA: hypothetical protein VFJ43_09855 [Bacteroidia bacterium]|nr:hypothetical protein [Bacteroidia bacterium]